MIKFHFYCAKCREPFRVSLENMKHRTHIACPDCGDELPDEAVQHLNRSAQEIIHAQQAFKSARENDPEKYSFPDSGHWTFTVVDTDS